MVATRLLSPGRAVAFAAFFNFAAYFLTLALPELHKVADTIGKGLIDKDLVTPAVVFGALVGAMFWNVVTWLKGIPVLVAATRWSAGSSARASRMPGFTGIQWTGLNKTLIAIVLSPTLGMILAMLIMLRTSWCGVRASASGAERTFRALHLVSSAAYSLSHGLNDAQKTMGIITVLLYSTGYLHGEFHVPHWVAISCYIAIGLGTLTGGWRIIETMGTRITKLSQHQGFSASTGGSIMMLHRLLARHPGLDHAHHHRLRHRRRRRPPRLGGPLGRRGQRHARLGHHHPRLGGGGRDLLLAGHAPGLVVLDPAALAANIRCRKAGIGGDGGDSNPRYGLTPYGGLANRWFQPLTHVSGCGERRL